MSHEIDGNRAIYARHPAWHKLGTVKEEGWFTADEALAVLNPNRDPVRKVQAGVFVDGKWLKTDDYVGIVDKDEDGKSRFLSFTKPEYGVVQLEDQFRFMDEVVGNIGGAHYETAARLRKGKQAFLTVDTGGIVLDPQGANDRVQKYILCANSFDYSLAFRVKMTNVRVECANLLAMALRGSSDNVMTGDWSTRHTANIDSRVQAARQTLGLWKTYNDAWATEADLMVMTKMTDATFDRLLVGLFTVENEKTGQKERDDEAIESVKTLYELSPTVERITGTIWGGLQAVTERDDWFVKVRGSKTTTSEEARFRRQFEGKGADSKQRAWDMFYSAANDAVRPVSVSV